MQHLEVSCAVRPILWPLGVKWLKFVVVVIVVMVAAAAVVVVVLSAVVAAARFSGSIFMVCSRRCELFACRCMWFW